MQLHPFTVFNVNLLCIVDVKGMVSSVRER